MKIKQLFCRHESGYRNLCRIVPKWHADIVMKNGYVTDQCTKCGKKE